MSKWIKNVSGVTKTYAGKDIIDTEYREIQEVNDLDWKKDNNLLTDIGNGDAIVAKDDSGSNDITDISEAINYLKNINVDLEIDEEGRQVSRSAYGKKGWSYIAHPVEFSTSTLDSLFCSNWLGTDRGDCSLKFYKADGTEITSGVQADLDSDCVETKMTMALDYDFEVISGKIEQHTHPTTNVRMWVVGGVIDSTTNKPWEYPTSSGVYHAKEFAGGINLKFLGSDQEIETDGRAAKYMAKTTTNVPYQTNQFQFILKHDVGLKHDLMVILEYFRA